MKFSFSSEQEEFRSNLRRFLVNRSPTKEVRRLMETDDGYERDGWRSINAELGLTAVRIPEAYGGQGFGFGEQCIVLEEMGRALLCAPFFATAVLAAAAILNAGTEAEKQALLARYRYVLQGMASMNTISDAKAQQAERRLPTFPVFEQSSKYGGMRGHIGHPLVAHPDLPLVLERLEKLLARACRHGGAHPSTGGRGRD